MPQRIAIFDVDHTITRVSTGTRLIQHGRRAGLFSIWSLLSLPYHYLHYRAGTFRIDRLAQKIDALADNTFEDLTSVANQCFTEHVRDDIMTGAADLIRDHQDAGDIVALATSSLALVVRPLAHELGIEHIMCTELEFHDGVATGRFVRPPCFAEEKLRCVTEFVTTRGRTLDEVTFYSDSRLDLPLLRAAGRAVAVNPDRGLRMSARREGWSILKFS
ncbi:MAG: HAD-IB family hydrolase [Spirochaetales bacterium]|nr:HAD-IB family hydrolase [Spirochaetales bacterium]